MDDTQQVSWIIMYSCIGVAYVLYGLKRSKRVAAVAGAGFLVVPHVLSGALLLLALGVFFFLAPILWRH
ncbi:MAG: hypothetical protein R3296_03090 [Oleiphilaceae bacterium]|nr:hypothetical protein [Oleiphilaceae bacterium]